MIDALRQRFGLSRCEAELLAGFIRVRFLHSRDTNDFGNLFRVRRNHIHKKLGREVIENQWGEGYLMNEVNRDWLKQEAGL